MVVGQKMKVAFRPRIKFGFKKSKPRLKCAETEA